MLRKATDPYKVQYNYAQLMHNNGFSDAQDLLARVKAWLHTFSYVRPDVAIFDHSPPSWEVSWRSVPWMTEPAPRKSSALKKACTNR